MAYLISYGPERVKHQTGGSRAAYAAGAALLLISLGIGIFWQDGREVLRLLLCPWLDEATVSAFQDMIEQIRGGTQVGEAVVVFCRQVISNAGIPV